MLIVIISFLLFIMKLILILKKIYSITKIEHSNYTHTKIDVIILIFYEAAMQLIKYGSNSTVTRSVHDVL